MDLLLALLPLAVATLNLVAALIAARRPVVSHPPRGKASLPMNAQRVSDRRDLHQRVILQDRTSAAPDCLVANARRRELTSRSLQWPLHLTQSRSRR